jgi:hypothetical protein
MAEKTMPQVLEPLTIPKPAIGNKTRADDELAPTYDITHGMIHVMPGLREQVVERLELSGHLHRQHSAAEVALLKFFLRA